MKRLRFKRQKHLIAAWFKRLELRRRPKPVKPPEPKDWLVRAGMIVKGLLK